MCDIVGLRVLSQSKGLQILLVARRISVSIRSLSRKAGTIPLRCVRQGVVPMAVNTEFVAASKDRPWKWPTPSQDLGTSVVSPCITDRYLVVHVVSVSRLVASARSTLRDDLQCFVEVRDDVRDVLNADRYLERRKSGEQVALRGETHSDEVGSDARRDLLLRSQLLVRRRRRVDN